MSRLLRAKAWFYSWFGVLSPNAVRVEFAREVVEFLFQCWAVSDIALSSASAAFTSVYVCVVFLNTFSMGVTTLLPHNGHRLRYVMLGDAAIDIFYAFSPVLLFLGNLQVSFFSDDVTSRCPLTHRCSSNTLGIILSKDLEQALLGGEDFAT
eukprot:g5452.t1